MQFKEHQFRIQNMRKCLQKIRRRKRSSPLRVAVAAAVRSCGCVGGRERNLQEQSGAENAILIHSFSITALFVGEDKACLENVFKNVFLVFKQYYIHFTYFFAALFSKNINNIIRTTFPNDS